MNLTQIEAGARLMLQGLEVDLADSNFASTPGRVAKVMAEMFNPPETGWPVFEEEYTDLVMIRNHEFYTLCPHHMLPVRIVATVAYIPNGQVVGASKLCRMLHEANRLPMTQEKLTQAAIDSINHYADKNGGAGVLLKGEHGCFRIRGVKSCADMITLKFSGQFETDELLQQRFLTLAKI